MPDKKKDYALTANPAQTDYDLTHENMEEFRSKLNYEFFENFTSEHTKKSYRRDIAQFTDFILRSFPNIHSPEQMERFHIVAFRNWLQDENLAPKTINRKLSAVSSYLDFLTEKGLLRHNPCQSIRRPKQVVKKPTNDLTDEQVSAILNSVPEDSASGPLHKAILYLLFSTGVRKAELINLKRRDLKKIGEHWTIEVKAKGGDQLLKVIHPLCVDVIHQYMDWMEKNGRKLSQDDWLFQPTKNPRSEEASVSGLNKPLRPSSIDYILKTACDRVGIDERISPHSARASYIGSALERGIDLWKISQDVGHASVKTTEIYNKRRQRMEESPAYDLGYFRDKKKA